MHHAWAWLPALLASLGGCAEAGAERDGGSSAGQWLNAGPGATLASANYTIEGPNGFVSAGTVAVGESPDVPITLGPLPVGNGYEVVLDATASDGVTVCTGRALFDVVDGAAVLTIVVHLTCTVPVGEISVVGTLNFCPVVDGLDASPLDVKLGGVSRLTLTAHDSDTGPAPLSYSWTVNGIKLTRQTSPSLNFACSSLGEVVIAGTVSDGDPNPACADTAGVKVTCQ
jgi:hypothetical protein